MKPRKYGRKVATIDVCARRKYQINPPDYISNRIAESHSQPIMNSIYKSSPNQSFKLNTGNDRKRIAVYKKSNSK